MNELDYSIHYKKWHDGSVRDYENSARWYGRVLTPVVSSIPKESRILDVGCGQGLLIYYLEKVGYTNVEGIDTSAQQIAVAKEHIRHGRLVDEAYLSQLARDAPDTYDAIFLFDVLEHISKEHQFEFIKSIHALLCPGGLFVVSVPNANSIFASRWQFIDWTHECSFTECSLDFLLLNASFRDITYYPEEFNMRPAMPFLIRKSVIRWLMFKFFRAIRRMEAIAEIGGRDGRTISLSLNLLAVARKGSNKN